MKGMGVVRLSSLPDRETLCKLKPKGVTRMKQGEKGCGRSKASGGRESLEALHSRVRQARCWSLLVSSSVVGRETPWKAVRGCARRSRLCNASGDLLGSFSERQGKGMRGWSV
jgi:hypothetical protein